MSCSILARPKRDTANCTALPRIGIALADGGQCAVLRAVVEACGFSVTHCSELAGDCAVRTAGTEVDAWLMDTGDCPAPSPAAGSPLPLVCNVGFMGKLPVLRWRPTVEQKLKNLVRDYQQICEARRAQNVWLLAASAGGLQAVRSFLEGLHSFHGVAFVYAQHIEAEQAEQLVKMITRNTPWRAQMALGGNLLTTGSVTVVPPAQRISLGNGLITTLSEPWPGPYAPNIDAVAAELASEYGSACGMIVFSGMGDDGVAGSRSIREKGGSVLVQSPADCTVPALSEAVLERGAFNQSGNVDELREAFVKLLNARSQRSAVLSRGVVCGRE
ncbi:MAG: chemotaxis protein CheB [Gammaproteobacteria bacterium]|nr:chemotaxis protein CheB [Gammaproteobacteria bacterium]MBQ0839149.1 chemotaxis protein CheB [Gammaproteobacteria bacterium]